VQLPDVGPLGSLAGWFLAVFIMASVLLMLIRGDLELGRTYREAIKREDATRETLKEQTDVIKGLVTGIDWLSEHLLGRERRRDDG
jgi:hypothetical protein